MIKADPEYYQSLQKALTIHRRWFNVALIGFMYCIGFAFYEGVNAGWPWLLGSLVFLMATLWTRIDQQHTHLLIQIYQASAK